MPQTALPNIGLDYEWDLGADSWKTGMDDNLALLDLLAQPRITVSHKTVSAQPGSPTNGSSYIIGASPTGADWGGSPEKEDWVAVWYTGTGWHFAEPREGWMVYNDADNEFRVFENGAWQRQGQQRWRPFSETGASVTLTRADHAFRMTRASGGADQVLSIDNTFQDGDWFIIHKTGAASCTVDGGSPLTIRRSGGDLSANVDIEAYVFSRRFEFVLFTKQGGRTWHAMEFHKNFGCDIYTTGVPGSPTNFFRPGIEQENSTMILRTPIDTLEIPAAATVPFTEGTILRFVCDTGSPGVAITDEAGVSWLLTDPTGGTLVQGEVLEIQKVTTNQWIVLRQEALP